MIVCIWPQEGMKMYNFYLQFFPDFHEDFNEEGDLLKRAFQLFTVIALDVSLLPILLLINESRLRL